MAAAWLMHSAQSHNATNHCAMPSRLCSSLISSFVNSYHVLSHSSKGLEIKSEHLNDASHCHRSFIPQALVMLSRHNPAFCTMPNNAQRAWYDTDTRLLPAYAMHATYPLLQRQQKDLVQTLFQVLVDHRAFPARPMHSSRATDALRWLVQ
jgi:hypothetical protein